MAFPNRYPALEIPAVSLPEFVLAGAASHGDRLAIVDVETARGYTYGQFHHLVERVAAGLGERGLAPGERVAVLLPNVPEFAVVFFGVLRAGGVVTTLNPVFTPREIAHQLADSGARLVVADAARRGAAEEAAAPTAAEVVTVGEPGASDALAALVGAGPPPEPPPIDPSTALAVLPYSSGTTGFPKGVLLTHRNLVANVLQTAASQEVTDRDVFAGILPFFHIYGMTVIMNLALWRGATIVSVPRFGVDTMLAAVERFRVTRLYAAPPIVLALAQHPAVERADLSSLRFILSGAAPLSGETARLCQDRVRCRVVQGYGLTETSPCTHLTADATVGVPQGSVGHALPDTECRIVDVVTGADLGPDEEGELLVRGPQVMAGYLNNPEATAAVVDGDGFFHTGDVGRIDADGHLYVVDRLKELIKHKGFQIAPAELEKLLLEHDDVADAAVIGYPDERAGEVPVAFVVAKHGRAPSSDELRAFVAERVAPYKQLAKVEFVDAIPRTASGKIQRRFLRDSALPA